MVAQGGKAEGEEQHQNPVGQLDEHERSPQGIQVQRCRESHRQEGKRQPGPPGRETLHQ